LKYELVYTRRAERDIKKLDAAIKKRISKTLLQYKENPLNYAE
jgi:mRNA interferase RelE/StbE